MITDVEHLVMWLSAICSVLCAYVNLCQPVFKRFHALFCVWEILYMSWNQVHDQLLHCLFRTWGNTATNHKAGKSLRWKATGDGGLWQFVILETTMPSFHTLGAVTHNTYSPRSTFSWNPNWGAVSKKMAQTMGIDYVSLRPLPFHPESQRNQQAGCMDRGEGWSQISDAIIVENLFGSVHEMSLKHTGSGMMPHVHCEAALHLPAQRCQEIKAEGLGREAPGFSVTWASYLSLTSAPFANSQTRAPKSHTVERHEIGIQLNHDTWSELSGQFNCQS